MTPEHWEKMNEIFGEALERDPAEREAFVRDRTKEDPQLLAEVLRLLEASSGGSLLLSSPALKRARPLSEREPLQFAPDAVLARRFRIVRFIARGGMGEVYEAEDLELGERVALKAIRRHFDPDSEVLALFKKEVQLARRVTHPNVCRVFNLERHEDEQSRTSIMLLSMELLEGRTLAEELNDTGPFSFEQALPLIEDIAAGLQSIHDAEIIHGDLKPGNVMLARRAGEARPRAVVMDFGMALPAAPDSSGRGFTRGGTPEYFTPEQLQGAPLTTASDVYTLALLISDMLGVPRLARQKPDAERMPPSSARALRRCLEREPSRRYSRPADLAAALRGSLGARARTLLRAGTATAVLAILAVFFWFRRPEPVQGTASRLLLTEEDTVSVRAPSPDGRLVAETSWDTGDLVLRDVVSGKVRRLTHSNAWTSGSAQSAKFSPDGRHVAYAWWTSRTASELRLIGTDGVAERTLYRNPDLDATPVDWSPDGSRILVKLSRLDGSEQVAILSTVDGSVQFPSLPPAARKTRILFAADGDGIVFDAPSARNAGAEIHQVSFGGAESTLVASTGNDNSAIGWSPDRRRLIFSSDRRGQPGIWAIAVSRRGVEGDAQELVPDAHNWAPLGITRTGVLFYRHDADSIDVFTAILDLAAGRTASPPQPVMDRFIGSYGYPNWSENGRRLVFFTRHDPRQPALVIYEPQTGARREVPVDLRFVIRPQWVERGSMVMALGATRGGIQGMFRIDPDTGRNTLFRTTKDLETGFEGVWSADGKTHFNRYADFRRGIFRLNVATGARRVIYVPPPGVDIGMENLTLSPDGRTLAFHARNDAAGTAAIMLLPVEGGEARTLFAIRKPQAFTFQSFAWTRDSRQILAAISNDNRTGEIWQVPVDGSLPRRIEFPAMGVAVLRLNPDGKTIAFQRANWRSEVWVLQDFL
jgi:Tol biopolymer transport system component